MEDIRFHSLSLGLNPQTYEFDDLGFSLRTGMSIEFPLNGQRSLGFLQRVEGNLLQGLLWAPGQGNEVFQTHSRFEILVSQEVNHISVAHELEFAGEGRWFSRHLDLETGDLMVVKPVTSKKRFIFPSPFWFDLKKLIKLTFNT